MADIAELAATSFCDIVREHAQTQGDVIAFTFGDEELSFAALDEGANRAANGLIALGVKPGDRVAFLGKNHPLYFEAFVGAARIGAVMTPVNWRLAPPEVAYILDNCGAEVVFVGEGFAAMIEAVRADVPHVSHIIGDITTASSSQSVGINEVNMAVTQLDQMTQQNAALVEESAAAATSLKDQATRLAQIIQTFHV